MHAAAASVRPHQRAAQAGGVPGGQAYRRREPERTLLHATVRAHWKTLLAEVAERSDGGSLPGFVLAEFERYLDCGVLAHGFARVRCSACAKDILVGLSCKGRGFCPSCTTRRMQGTALHLVDHVLPPVPVRQWVLSLPRWVRFLLARDPALITRTLDLTLREVFKCHRRRARRTGARGPRTGAVTFVQRFGSVLNLNVHFHCVIPDGVFVRDDGAIRFEPLGPPSDGELKTILRSVAARVRKLLGPRADAARDDARPLDALAFAQAESVSALLGKPPAAQVPKKHTAYFEGFSLHAGVHLHANDRQGLAHLCGYGARPPLSQERLSALPDGRLSIRLKRPLRDGSPTLVLEPVELLRRLATLVPPPRAHLVRFHGVFGPASKWRSEIVPSEPPPAAPRPEEARPAVLSTGASGSRKQRRPDARIPWADLLRRVFFEDVLACPCGGRRKVIAFIHEGKTIKAILEALGLPTTAPPLLPSHSKLQDEPVWQDEVPTLQHSLH